MGVKKLDLTHVRGLSEEEAAKALYFQLRQQQFSPNHRKFAALCLANRFVRGHFMLDLEKRARWTGNCWRDYKSYINNQHKLFGIFYANDFHPLGRTERLVIFLCGILCSLFATSMAEVLSQETTISNSSIIFSVVFGFGVAIYMYILKKMGLCQCVQSLPSCARQCIQCTGHLVMFIQFLVSILFAIIGVLAYINAGNKIGPFMENFGIVQVSNVFFELAVYTLLFGNNWNADVEKDRKKHKEIRQLMTKNQMPISASKQQLSKAERHIEVRDAKQTQLAKQQHQAAKIHVAGSPEGQYGHVHQQQQRQTAQQGQMHGVVPMQTFKPQAKATVHCVGCQTPFYITHTQGTYACPNCKAFNRIQPQR